MELSASFGGKVLSNLTTIDVGEGIHYLQEDHPHEIGEGIAKWYRGL
jgi:haloalkane dehalogenase